MKKKIFMLGLMMCSVLVLGGDLVGAAENKQMKKRDSWVENLDQLIGQKVNGGQSYGLTAHYVEQLGGPQLMGSGKIYASDIGIDYDWSSYGWVTIMNPKYSDIQPGDILNYKSSSAAGFSLFGHTGIVVEVLGEGRLTLLEQNAEAGPVVEKYTRIVQMNEVSSVVRKAN